MTRLRKFGYFALGCTVFALATEVVLQLLPVSTATRLGQYSAKPFVSYPPSGAFQSAYGWDLRHPQSHRINQSGFVSSRERDAKKPALGIVGDSMVEGSAVKETDRVTERIQSHLPSRDAVMLGFPDASLVSYLDHISWAEQKLGVLDYIIFVNMNDANESLCDALGATLRCYEPSLQTIKTKPSFQSASLAKKILSHSATLQYFLGHLSASPSAVLAHLNPWRKRAPAGAPPALGALNRPEAEQAIAFFIDALAARKSGNVLLVTDCDRARLYKGETLPPIETYAALERLAKDKGLPVFNLCAAFREAYQSSSRRTEVSFDDSHWNARGHAIAAQAVSRAWQRAYGK
jgi:hypothetical protein